MDTFLSHIQPESALELLTRVRKQTDPPGATFISNLDNHIVAAIQDGVAGDSTLNRGDVIEVQGPAASGKTQLLHFFAMTCVLPVEMSITCSLSSSEAPSTTSIFASTRTVQLGGRGKAVVICDCDGRWSMLRLHDIIHSYLSTKFAQNFEVVQGQASNIPNATLQFTPTASEIAKQCLKRAHLFRPTSSMSLATTLLALPTYHQQKMPDQELLMVFIDSISAFHHSDKWVTEEANLAPRPSTNKTAAGQPLAPRADLKAMTHIIKAIQPLQRSHGVITFITNWALITPDNKSLNNYIYDNNKPFYGQHLLHPYPQPPGSSQSHVQGRHATAVPTGFPPFTVTHHITLPGTEFAILPFPVGTSFADALEDEERRAVVEDQRVTALVRTQQGTPEGDSPNAIVLGSFEFAIRDRNIGVD
ncbi:hypothetical protein M407DRAFT_25436 [Tulasnella calospora MUT 4182]|uniref:DNA recombination and repair protein Rad51-like C-terminal domain-containing protein n=1 Tax=Tulasnella calospora MUT 4182 TaxID=1051891 RepID=A0A0C3LUZ1_9AGAM|nr:hypothetical protein M407DRAFT_25436 [Tulasnella calospora MUT 4182]